MVSIITPCYNSAAYISETIQSVLNQTYKDWEMIIIDDGSSDESAEIISKFLYKDKRIKYFRTESPTGSPSFPRNIGLDKAMGKYIAFLDSDDLWLPNKLQEQIDFLERNNFNLVYSFYEKIDEEGNRDNRVIKTKLNSTYESLLKSNSIPFLTAVIRKDAIGKTRFKQIPQEDFCFWLDILKKGYTAYNLPEVTALYRVVKHSRSANKFHMFKGYWNVIRREQGLSWVESSKKLVFYIYIGLKKYIR